MPTATYDASEETIWGAFSGNAKSIQPPPFLNGETGKIMVRHSRRPVCNIPLKHSLYHDARPGKGIYHRRIHHYTDGSRDTPDIMLGYFDYPDRNNTGAFTVQLGANYVDGVSKKWGSMDFRIVGSKGSLDVGWDKIVLKTTGDVNTKDFEALGELGQEFDAPRKVSSREYVFNAKKGYKGGHYDHHFNFFNGIRNNTPLTADVLFAVRTAAPALLSYESYLRNEAIKWDAQKLKIRK